MKKIVLVTLLTLINTIIINSQSWNQIGADIDGEAADDFSGVSVSLSSDGEIMAIGARSNNGNGENSGHVRVYKYINENWIQIGEDIDGKMAGDYFGQSVSLNANGGIVAIGAMWNDDNGEKSGHVRVFKNQGGVWQQLGGELKGEQPGDEFGSSVSLSADGTIVAIGANNNDENGNNSGHVRVYHYANGIWSQIGTDIDGEANGDLSGVTHLSNDGKVLAIGATRNDGNGILSGHVRIYQLLSNSWVQIGNDIDGEEQRDQSGHSVCLNGDGSIVAIGAIYNDGNGENSGHVRIYKNQNGAWIQIGEDINGEHANDHSGYSVSLNDEGSVVSIGASGNSDSALSSGHVRIFQNQNNVWTQIGNDIDGEALGDYSGVSNSLSANGSIVAIGAPWNDGNGMASGHVRVFKNTPPKILHQPVDIIDICANEMVNFLATSNGNSTYQWEVQENNTTIWNTLNDINGIIDGSDSKLLTVKAKKLFNKSKFRCKVGDNSGWVVYSEEAQLILEQEKPSISCVANKMVKRNTNKYYVVNGDEFDAYDIDDNCDISYVSNNFNWKPTLANAKLPLGENKIIWFVLDTAGNFSYCSTKITVVKFLVGKSNPSKADKSIDVTDIIIYPNPTKKHLNINTQARVKSISIIDMTGKTVYKIANPNQTKTIDLSILKLGIYIVKIHTNSRVFTKRIIKQ
jgi:hypothetical protein